MKGRQAKKILNKYLPRSQMLSSAVRLLAILENRRFISDRKWENAVNADARRYMRREFRFAKVRIWRRLQAVMAKSAPG
jgi:hypothetical protein